MINLTLLSLSFLAGIALFFSPCGVALLPAYISYLLAQEEKQPLARISYILRGLKIGLITSSGVLTVFILAGILISTFGNFLAPYSFWFGSLTGLALIILGILMFINKGLTLNVPHHFQSKSRNKYKQFYLYGVGYALGGIGCTLPAFLLVVFTSLTGGSFISGLINFLAFSTGTISLMLLVSIATAISKSFIEKWIKAKLNLIQKLSALIIILAGFYLIYFNLNAFIL